MQFEPIAEGFVSQRQPHTATAVALSARCAVTTNGDVVCTFIAQSKLGIGDTWVVLCRSTDNGRTWSEQGALWTPVQREWSIYGSVGRALNGNLIFFGARHPIDHPDELLWSEATQGIKQNELVWAESRDGGHHWSDLTIIPMPIAGSAEAPGAMCVTRSGRWVCCYAPYNTFDPNLVVDRNQVVTLRSDDQGKTWKHNSMIRFASKFSTAAEAWIVELADGRLLGTAWHLNQQDNSDHPNAYALSRDAGETWTPTRSTDIMGQSAALAALPDGRALFVYNQRKLGTPGVWLAIVRPTEKDFGVEANEIIWRAETRTQSGTSGAHSEWLDFSFGEPSVTLLPDNTMLVTLWCIQPSGQGIRFVKLRMRESSS